MPLKPETQTLIDAALADRDAARSGDTMAQQSTTAAVMAARQEAKDKDAALALHQQATASAHAAIEALTADLEAAAAAPAS